MDNSDLVDQVNDEGNAMKDEEVLNERLRSELIVQVDQAILAVRDLVTEMNEREKEYMHTNSAVYRQLVDTIKNWYRDKDGGKGA